MSQLLNDLRALDALFAPGASRWTQGRFARDERGEPVSALSEKAVCWCLDGGARKVANGALSDRYSRLCDALTVATPRGASDYVLWQDQPGRKFHQVKALIARAIADEEGRVGQ